MGRVIEIKFHEDLPTRARNRLRYAMEMGVWRAERRRLKALADTHPDDDRYFAALDRHDRDYEMVGLP